MNENLLEKSASIEIQRPSQEYVVQGSLLLLRQTFPHNIIIMLIFERSIFVLVKFIKFQPQDKEPQNFFKTYKIEFGAHTYRVTGKI